MIKNKPWLIFTGVNLVLWSGVSATLRPIDFEIIGLMWFLAIFVSGFILVKVAQYVPSEKLIKLNIIASFSMVVVVIPTLIFSMELGVVLFLVLLFGGTFFILFMGRDYYPRVIYDYSSVRPGRAANNIFRNTGLNDPQGKVANTHAVHGGKAGSDVSNSQSGFNPANGMPMLETGFDMQGNVYGTNSADNFTHNRGFGHADAPGFGLSDYHSIDISPSHDWHTHDTSISIHSDSYGVNEY